MSSELGAESFGGEGFEPRRGQILENRVCGAFYAANRLAFVQTAGKTLGQMFYHQNYPLTSVISALKAGRSDGVGLQGCRESMLCRGIKGAGNVFTAGFVMGHILWGNGSPSRIQQDLA